MTTNEFLGKLTKEQRGLVERVLRLIETCDPPDEVKVDRVMGADALVLMSEGRNKYGFRIGKQVSFDYMVMYCNPHIRERFAGTLGVPKSRVGKSCITLTPRDELDEAALAAMLRAGAKCPWPSKS